MISKLKNKKKMQVISLSTWIGLMNILIYISIFCIIRQDFHRINKHLIKWVSFEKSWLNKLVFLVDIKSKLMDYISSFINYAHRFFSLGAFVPRNIWSRQLRNMILNPQNPLSNLIVIFWSTFAVPMALKVLLLQKRKPSVHL